MQVGATLRRLFKMLRDRLGDLDLLLLARPEQHLPAARIVHEARAALRRVLQGDLARLNLLSHRRPPVSWTIRHSFKPRPCATMRNVADRFRINAILPCDLLEHE